MTEPSEMHEAMCPALTGGRCTCERNDPAVDKAWARFCGGIGDGPDAPYPGMISAFERYYSQSFTDKDWRNEASVWAAAWKQALLTAAAPTTQPAPQQEAPADELEEVLRERDDAEDFINELLDEVLGADRPEWSSAYNRYDAMNDVRERITALHKPAVDRAWTQFEAATKQPGDVVAYLDVGAGGYLDLGTDLADEALSRLPKGRHALVIAGTYGIDGYVAAPQPSPTAQAAESVPAEEREKERIAFKDAHRHLELDEVPDAWGRPMFKHSHVETSWLGWIARAARAPADSVLEDAARYRWLRQHWFTMLSNYQRGITFKLGGPRWSDITEAELDAAIDAARKQGGAT